MRGNRGIRTRSRLDNVQPRVDFTPSIKAWDNQGASSLIPAMFCIKRECIIFFWLEHGLGPWCDSTLERKESLEQVLRGGARLKRAE